MRQLTLPAAFYRGGTSNAVVFRQEDLPPDRELWTEIFIAAMGSPDPALVCALRLFSKGQAFAFEARKWSQLGPSREALAWYLAPLVKNRLPCAIFGMVAPGLPRVSPNPPLSNSMHRVGHCS